MSRDYYAEACAWLTKATASWPVGAVTAAAASEDVRRAQASVDEALKTTDPTQHQTACSVWMRTIMRHKPCATS